MKRKERQTYQGSLGINQISDVAKHISNVKTKKMSIDLSFTESRIYADICITLWSNRKVLIEMISPEQYRKETIDNCEWECNKLIYNTLEDAVDDNITSWKL